VCGETDAAARAAADKLTNPFFNARVVGSPATCAAQLDEMLRRYAADEMIFAEVGVHQARSLELLAGEVLR
jgi:alkanesulfonate monooxygenase SsuD/methylene tetrahydromethanopterin reductase-like flavin-dependent oxidoreductase (luciferase family)